VLGLCWVRVGASREERGREQKQLICNPQCCSALKAMHPSTCAPAAKRAREKRGKNLRRRSQPGASSPASCRRRGASEAWSRRMRAVLQPAALARALRGVAGTPWLLDELWLLLLLWGWKCGMKLFALEISLFEELWGQRAGMLPFLGLRTSVAVSLQLLTKPSPFDLSSQLCRDETSARVTRIAVTQQHVKKCRLTLRKRSHAALKNALSNTTPTTHCRHTLRTTGATSQHKT